MHFSGCNLVHAISNPANKCGMRAVPNPEIECAFFCCRINIGRYTFKEAKFCSSLGKRKLVNVKCRQCALRGIPFIDGLGDSNMGAPELELGWEGSQPGV